jgi:protein-tyrosine phosphatase
MVDVIVFTAEEYQPDATAFPGVRVRHCPFDDTRVPSDRDIGTAWSCAEAVARDMRRGRRVLVTCRMGRNRSALVAALALHLVTGESGAEVFRLVRSRRTDDVGVPALSNPTFQRLLVALPAGY